MFAVSDSTQTLDMEYTFSDQMQGLYLGYSKWGAMTFGQGAHRLSTDDRVKFRYEKKTVYGMIRFFGTKVVDSR